LVRLVAKHYHRTEDEGRTLVQTALASAADLIVGEKELHIVLTPMSSAHRSRAVSEVCEEINACAVNFPGSNLRLCYSVAGAG